MTELEDALRATLRAHERDIDASTIRRDYAAIASRGRRPARRLLPVLAAGAVVAIVGLVAYMAWPLGGTPTDRAAGTPMGQNVAPPPADSGPFQVWLSERVIPAAGADIGVLLTGPAEPVDENQQIFGVGAELDTWDGTQWQLHRNAGLCTAGWDCIGELLPLDEEFSVQEVGLVLDASGVGSATFLRVEGLDPGWYRLRQTSSAGIQATGTFQVVADDIPVTPIGARDIDHLSVRPALLPTAGGTVTVSRTPVPQESADSPANTVGESLDLEAWTGDGWQPVSTLAVTPAPDDPYRATPLVQVPALNPGAHRLVDRNQPGEAHAVFWVDDNTSATPLPVGSR